MKICHISDTHLSYNQYWSSTRKRDFMDSFKQAIEVAISNQVSAVVHSGDLFNNTSPPPEDLAQVAAQLSKLKENNIKFLIIAGNHDKRRQYQFADFFEDIGVAKHLSTDPVIIRDVPFIGADYSGRNSFELPKLKGGILVLHQLLEECPVPGGEFGLGDLKKSESKLVLLGDWHEYEVWQNHGQIVTYSGSTERFSTKEKQPRTVSIIDFDTLELERIKLNTREFIYLDNTNFNPADLEGKVIKITSNNSSVQQEIKSKIADAGVEPLTIRLPTKQEQTSQEDQEDISINLDFSNIDNELDKALANEEISSELVSIIRNLEVADSKVDDVVTGWLQEVVKNNV